MRIAGTGHAVFAVLMIGVGILGLAQGGFAPVWEPVPKWVPAREALVWLSAFISLGSGLGLLWRRAAAPAAGMLLVSLLLWVLVFRLPGLARAPGVAANWEGCGETVVMLAGAWALYAGFVARPGRLAFAGGHSGLRIARSLYGLALIPFGLAHFAYVKETAALVPGWLPAHVAWVYFTGAAYLAAGAAVLSGVWARPAAALSAVQMGLFTLLVWVPVVAAAGPKQAFQWSETVVSAALTAAAWVVAESWQGSRSVA